jgi:hypothetical protein
MHDQYKYTHFWRAGRLLPALPFSFLYPKLTLIILTRNYTLRPAFGHSAGGIAVRGRRHCVWRFKGIVGHDGPLTKNHLMWKGSIYNVRVEWENRETSNEPMTTIAADDPVTRASYAKDNNLLDVPGWERFKSIARCLQHMFCMANQAKLRSFRLAPKYKYGFEIPPDYKHAKELDEKHGTTRWVDATSLEMVQLDNYDCFHDQGKGVDIPKGFKKICVHLVYDVKHDVRHTRRDL